MSNFVAVTQSQVMEIKWGAEKPGRGTVIFSIAEKIVGRLVETAQIAMIGFL